MTITVFIGQLYVGTGYRALHLSMQELIGKVDGVLFHASPKDEPNFLWLWTLKYYEWTLVKKLSSP